MNTPLTSTVPLNNYIRQFYLVHYVDSQELLHMLNSFECMCENPRVREPLTQLQKSIFMCKILQALHQNMYSQSRIIEKIKSSIKVYLTMLHEICDKDEVKLIEKVLKHMEECGDIKLEEQLCIFLDSYPKMHMWTSVHNYGQQFSSMIPWVLSHFVNVSPELTYAIANSFSADLVFMPSITACIFMSHKLLNDTRLTTPESERVLYFNQIALWTLVLFMFHQCIFNGLVMQRIVTLSKVLRVEIRKIFNWLNSSCSNNYIKDDNLKIVLETLVISNTSDSHLSLLDVSELQSVCQNLKATLSEFRNTKAISRRSVIV